MTTNSKYTVTVYKGSCGIAAGADKVYNHFEKQISEKKIDVNLRHVSCIGMCHSEVLVAVEEKGKDTITYSFINPRKADRMQRDRKKVREKRKSQLTIRAAWSG